MKKVKGTSGRKGRQANKAASKKDANQETGTDTGKHRRSNFHRCLFQLF